MKGNALYSWELPKNLNWVEWDGKSSESPVPLGKEHVVKARFANDIKGAAELLFPIPLYFHVYDELDIPDGGMDWKHHNADHPHHRADIVAYAIVD